MRGPELAKSDKWLITAVALAMLAVLVRLSSLSSAAVPPANMPAVSGANRPAVESSTTPLFTTVPPTTATPSVRTGIHEHSTTTRKPYSTTSEHTPSH